MIEHSGPISGIAAHSNGLILTAGYDNQVVVWDGQSRNALARGTHDHLANHVAISPDGQHAVTSSSDYSARVWRLPEMRLEAVFSQHGDDVEMSSFSPEGDRVATACRDGVVRVFATNGQLLTEAVGHQADVISVVWSRCGEQLMSSSDDGTIRRWDARAGEQLELVNLGNVETDTVAVSGTGTIYAGTDAGQLLQIIDGVTVAIDAHKAGIKRVVLDEQTNRLVSLSYDRTMSMWNVANDSIELLRVDDLPSDVWPRSCAFANANTLVFATFGASYRSYDTLTGEWQSDDVAPTAGINSVCVTSGGQRITVGDAGQVAIDGQLTEELGSLANFVVDVGHRAIAGGQLGIVFDARNGDSLYQHSSPLNCAAGFVRRGQEHVVIGTYTGEGLIFALDDASAELVATVKLHENAVKGVAASNDWIFSVSADASATWTSIDELSVHRTLDAAHDKIANGCVHVVKNTFASVSRDLHLRFWGPDGLILDVPTPHQNSIKCLASSPDGRWVATGDYHGTVHVFDTSLRAFGPAHRPTMTGISSIIFDASAASFVCSSYDGALYDIDVDDEDCGCAA